MPKRPDVAADLEELLDSIPPMAPPANLGNFPDDPAVQAAPAPPHDDDPPAEPETPAEPAREEPPTDELARETGPTSDQRLADLEARLASQTREIDFLRRGAAVAQPASTAPSTDITPETILPFDVSEDDLATIVAGGPKAAEAVRNALRATAYAGALAATRYLTARYEQERSQTVTADSMRETFWSRNADLADYPDIVATAAQQVAQQYPHADAESLITATSQRARARLGQMGVRVGGTAAASPGSLPRVASRTTRRPATSEMGGGSRPNGKTHLTSVERDILSLVER